MMYGQQQRQFAPQRNNGYRQQPMQPQRHAAQLQRQASELKSMYPAIRWCAVYVNTGADTSPASSFNDNMDVTSAVPQTNIYVPMDMEENIMAEVQMYIDEDKEITERLQRQKEEIHSAKNKVEDDKNEKIATFMSFTSITDRNRARQLLESNDWDLQKAAAQQFRSSPNVHSNNEGPAQGYQNANNNNHSSAQKAVIRMILPDNRQYTYQMDGNDTFWGVYGRLLQSVPELASKAFSLELQNGHVLNENEFDQTLVQAHLIPRGDIRIKY